MQARSLWTLPLLALFVMAATSACVVGHLQKDIHPPGGCDQCHRGKISNDWEVTVAPIEFGREGGVRQSEDIVFRTVRQVPYHKEVPSKRLEIFAAAAEPEAVGDQETGIQCFVCHRSPDLLHQSDRGQFPHPWDRPREEK